MLPSPPRARIAATSTTPRVAATSLHPMAGLVFMVLVACVPSMIAAREARNIFRRHRSPKEVVASKDGSSSDLASSKAGKIARRSRRGPRQGDKQRAGTRVKTNFVALPTQPGPDVEAAGPSIVEGATAAESMADESEPSPRRATQRRQGSCGASAWLAAFGSISLIGGVAWLAWENNFLALQQHSPPPRRPLEPLPSPMPSPPPLRRPIRHLLRSPLRAHLANRPLHHRHAHLRRSRPRPRLPRRRRRPRRYRPQGRRLPG